MKVWWISMQDWLPWTNPLHIPKSCGVFDRYTLPCSCHTSDVSTLSIHKVLGIHELCVCLTCSLVHFENVHSSSDFMHFWTEVVNTVIRAKATSCQNNCIYVTGQCVHVGRDIFPFAVLRFDQALEWCPVWSKDPPSDRQNRCIVFLSHDWSLRPLCYKWEVRINY